MCFYIRLFPQEENKSLGRTNGNQTNTHMCVNMCVVFYVSKGLRVGFRMCLMLAPGWDGLKGAKVP